jgi:hypothetical protein
VDEKFAENANTDATPIFGITASPILISPVVSIPLAIFVPFVTVTFLCSKD